jgi:hypothetical protein
MVDVMLILVKPSTNVVCCYDYDKQINVLAIRIMSVKSKEQRGGRKQQRSREDAIHPKSS